LVHRGQQQDQSKRDASGPGIEEELGDAGVFPGHVLADAKHQEGEDRQGERGEHERLTAGRHELEPAQADDSEDEDREPSKIFSLPA
jgi:hypothetical protein